MSETNKQVTVYINESDEWRHRPLHLEILELLEHEGLSGGTVLRAIAGFSKRGGIHTTSLVELGGRLPLVVQFVESEENVAKVVPRIREMAPVRLITVQSVEVIA